MGLRGRNVVLVGGGHAHVQVLERWRTRGLAGCRLTLVVDRPSAIYSGMVPGFVAGQYSEADLSIDLPALAQHAGARLVLAAARRIDARARRIELDDGRDVSYDLASIDVGSTAAGLSVPGAREFAIPVRPIHALIEGLGTRVDAPSRVAGRAFHAAVVGGGAGGVELAFALRARLRQRDARVRLIESASRLLPGWPASLARRVERICGELGVEVRVAARVAAVRDGELQLTDGQRLPADAVVWVAGPAAPALIRASGLATDERGFLRVRSTLQALDFDDLLAAGDAATLEAYPTTPKAGVFAVRAGPVLLENLWALLHGSSLRRFRPQRGVLALLNACDGRAVGSKWGLSFEGSWAFRLKDRIDRRFVERFRVEAPR